MSLPNSWFRKHRDERLSELRAASTPKPHVRVHTRKDGAVAVVEDSDETPTKNGTILADQNRQQASELGDEKVSSTRQVEDPDNPSANLGNGAVAEVENAPDNGSLIRLETRESVALIILATLAILSAMYAAQVILIPTAFSLLLALTLRPIVRRLRKYRISDTAGAFLTLLFIFLSIAAVGLNLLDPAREWIQEFPRQAATVRTKIDSLKGSMSSLSEASSQVQDIADGDSEEEPVPVEVRAPGYATGLSVLSNTGFLVGNLVLVICLSFFFLSAGDALLNNVLHLISSWTEKKRAVELVYEIERGIASYLLTVTIINILLGVAVGIAMWLLGVPNPALWGLMATLFNYVPIFGAVIGFVIIAVVSVITFDSLAFAAVPPVIFAMLTSLEGNVITPAILGRSMSLNPILVLLSLVFWGWLWGVSGAFLAVPMLAVAKIICERFEKTEPLAVLMEA
ncbi:MAG: AI-2E family transporter [Planctomycetaceae bacterium]|nr:AI-2E family transporter [Planctomycetaceae bacterium]